MTQDPAKPPADLPPASRWSGSHVVVVAVAIGGLLLIVVTILLLLLYNEPVAREVKSGNVTVHYPLGVPRSRAQLLARYLEVEEFGQGKPIEARLTRRADAWVVDLFVIKTSRLEKDPEFTGLLTLLRHNISARLFKDDPVIVRACERRDIESRAKGDSEPIPWKVIEP